MLIKKKKKKIKGDEIPQNLSNWSHGERAEKNTYWKRVLSLEKDFQKWVSSDLHCCMKVLRFRSVALAFSFFACTSFLPALRSVPIFFPPLIPATSFFSLYNSRFSMVDLWWAIFGLCTGSYMHHCNPIVIVLIFKALLLKLLRPNFLILSPLTAAVIS